MNALNDLEDVIDAIYQFLLKLLRKRIPSEKIIDEKINILIDAESKNITIDVEIFPSSLSSIKDLNSVVNQIVDESILFGKEKLREYVRSDE